MLALGVSLVTSLLADRLLGSLGLPADDPLVHPPRLARVVHKMEFRYSFVSNSQGLRNPEIPLAKPVGAFRVIVIGDSFTEGYGVEQEETFSALLSRRFTTEGRRVDFINGGLAGAGPLEYGRALFAVGLRYQPDAVLICFYANDVQDTDRSSSPDELYETGPRRTGLKRFVHAFWPRTYTMLKRAAERARQRPRPRNTVEALAQEARRRGVPDERISEWKARLPTELVEAARRGVLDHVPFGIGLWAPRHWIEALDLDTAGAQEKWKATERLLNGIVAGSRQRGLQVAAVYIPSRFQYSPLVHRQGHPSTLSGGKVRPQWLTDTTELQRRLRTWAEAGRVPLLDLSEPFRRAAAVREDLHFTLDEHWTPQGHRLAAESIGDWLVKASVFGGTLGPP